MDNRRIDAVIREHSDSINEGSLGYWHFTYRGQMMLTITDESHNRMRVMAPATPAAEVGNEVLQKCMEANFDRALDARYALSGDYLWSAFIHPLTELGERQFVDGMNQVAALAENYGTTFTSSELFFGGN